MKAIFDHTRRTAKRLGSSKEPSDDIFVNLYGLTISLQRKNLIDIPHEVTIIVPRAEVRHRYDHKNDIEETEIILSSITIAHSPRPEPTSRATHLSD